MSSSSAAASLQPVPAPRTPRGRQVAKEFVSAVSEKIDAKKSDGGNLNPVDNGGGSSERRRPLVWTKDEFNLTELIDSVEKNILKLEEMENRTMASEQQQQQGGGGLQLLALPLTEEILNLPGYKPKVTRQKSGQF